MFSRYNRIIKSAINIYFEERAKGMLPEEARKKVIENLVPESERDRVQGEYKGFMEVVKETVDTQLSEEQINIMENEGGILIRKICILALAICARQTEKLLTPDKSFAYLNKINKVFDSISRKYPQLQESKYYSKYE